MVVLVAGLLVVSDTPGCHTYVEDIYLSVEPQLDSSEFAMVELPKSRTRLAAVRTLLVTVCAMARMWLFCSSRLRSTRSVKVLVNKHKQCCATW